MERVFCPYCGCGCILHVQCSKSSSRIEKTLPDDVDVVSAGQPCTKGLTIHEMLETNRIETPMIRREKQGDLGPCSWDEAFAFISNKLRNMSASEPSLRDRVYFLGSGEFTNEANFLLSKLARSHFGSNNIDSCARLCHAATGAAFMRMYGLAAIPEHTMDDVRSADSFLFVGTDPMEDYPVLFNRVLAAQRDGAVITTIDLASNSTTEQADHNFKITPDGILPLLSHLIVMLVDGGDISRDARQIEGYDRFLSSARVVAREFPPSSFGFTKEDMERLYWIINDAKNLVIGFGMGLTQHKNGTQNVYGIAGLSMLLDAILFPNRGKVNVQGAGDVGADPFFRPNESELPGFEWSTDFMSHDGHVITEGLYDDKVEFVWIMGGNPSQSMPDLNKLDSSFRRKFIVFQHNHPVRTMEFADVVLPSTALPEEFGSVTNGERRVRGIYDRDCHVSRRTTIGSCDEEIKGNACIVSEFARHIGARGFDYSSLTDVFEEMVRVVPDYEGLNLKEVGSIEGQFARKEPKFKHLIAYRYEKMHFQGEGEYPFVFTTARNRFQFCTGGGTRCSRTLRDLAGAPAVFINPQDAEILGLSDGSSIHITSKAGDITATVKLDAGVEKRVLVAPFHFEKLLVNRLTPLDLDPESGTPCYKEVPVKVVRA